MFCLVYQSNLLKRSDKPSDLPKLACLIRVQSTMYQSTMLTTLLFVLEIRLYVPFKKKEIFKENDRFFIIKQNVCERNPMV